MKNFGRDEKMTNGGHVTTSNVLDDLGLDPQSALELKIKYEIHSQLVALIERRGYTQRDLEKALDVPQPRVSELMRGKLGTLSVSKLLYYAKRLGTEPTFILKEAA
jgi:predicted XRE-type DNA-binding protein